MNSYNASLLLLWWGIFVFLFNMRFSFEKIKWFVWGGNRRSGPRVETPIPLARLVSRIEGRFGFNPKDCFTPKVIPIPLAGFDDRIKVAARRRTSLSFR